MEDAARAIADPVRREILAMLREGDRTAGEIADAFDISRPAISRHLRVLREAGLAIDEPVGRRRVYRLDLTPLDAISTWIRSMRTPVGGPWDARLDALDTEVRRARRHRTRKRPDAQTSVPKEETA